MTQFHSLSNAHGCCQMSEMSSFPQGVTHIRNHTDRGTSSKETPLAPSNNTSDPGSQPSIVAVHSGQLKVSQPLPIQHKLNQEKGDCIHFGFKAFQNVELPPFKASQTCLLHVARILSWAEFWPSRLMHCCRVTRVSLFLTLGRWRKMFALLECIWLWVG